MPDITIDGTSISGVTIDGTKVQEVTIDGSVAWARVFKDSFEDGGYKDNWSTSKDTKVTVVDTPAIDGTYSLEVTGGQNTYQETVTVNSDVGQLYDYGTNFDFWAQTTYPAKTIGGLNFVTNGSNRHRVELDYRNSYFSLEYYDGSNQVLLTNSVSYSSDTWYRVKVEWDTSGNITVRLFNSSGTEKSNISVTDADTSIGGGSSLEHTYEDPEQTYYTYGSTSYFDAFAPI